jgi:hypothetical protein
MKDQLKPTSQWTLALFVLGLFAIICVTILIYLFFRGGGL